MIPIDDLLYDLDLKLNKLATTRHQSIPDEDKIIALNEAQLQLIKQKVGTNNIYRAGLESFGKRVDDLQVLMVSDHPLSLHKATNQTYLADIQALNNYLFFNRSYILADKDCCKDWPIAVTLIAHADVGVWQSNKHLCPSFEYQETFATLGDHMFTVYTDGSFTPTRLLLSYVRYPQKVDIPGYIHFDGSPSIKTDSELPAYLKDELVDLAVLEIAASTENLNAVQLTKDRIQQNE